MDVDVEVTNADGSTTPHHVHVDIDNHSNAAAIADALAHKLRKKTGLSFQSVPSTNPVTNEIKGRDLEMPSNVKVTKVDTRKRLDTPKPGEANNPPGKQDWERADDHVKVYDGPNQQNAGSPPLSQDEKKQRSK